MDCPIQLFERQTWRPLFFNVIYTKLKVHSVHVADNTGLSSFIQPLLHPKSAKSREIPRKIELTAVQGHPSSSTLEPIKSKYATPFMGDPPMHEGRTDIHTEGRATAYSVLQHILSCANDTITFYLRITTLFCFFTLKFHKNYKRALSVDYWYGKNNKHSRQTNIQSILQMHNTMQTSKHAISHCTNHMMRC